MSVVVVRNEVTTWGCSVTAWPGQSAATDDEMTTDAVAGRVLGALTRELSALTAGEMLRVVTAFGVGKIETDLLRSGILPTQPRTTLGDVVGLGPWSAVDALAPIGGPTIGTVSVLNEHRVFVPWHRVDLAGVWSAVADRLGGNRRQVAVIVDVLATPPPTLAQEAMEQALLTAAQRRAQRRGQIRSGEKESAPVLAGDLIISVGAAGDFGALNSVWRDVTGTSLIQYAAGAPVPDRQSAARVTSSTAATLLPLPVLSAHTDLPVRRFRPASTTVTRPLNVNDSVVLARTDSGAAVGFRADTVNRNMLIVGDVGSGKSTTCMSMLTSLWNDHGIPWLVIDPLKSEYSHLTVNSSPGSSGAQVPVRHLRLGERPINPMIVPDGVNQLAFASVMAQAFSSTTALGEAFPLGEQIARAAFNDLYSPRSEQIPRPTLADLEAALMAASYQESMTGEAVSNIRTSLLGRLRAITSGVAGDVFCGGPQSGIDWAALSAFPTVITFPPGLGQHEKAIIYALLVASHWAWRTANPTDGRHLIVLEEVHQVYGISNPIAAEVLDSLLATMRASGQGYLAVTPTPHQLSDKTQRLFSNLVAHRVRHTEGLDALRALGVSAQDVQSLDDGEVVALFHETAGLRGRVIANTRADATPNPMLPAPSWRLDEFTTPGPQIRGWCAACPAPCRGRGWLGMSRDAAESADAVLRSGEAISAAAVAAVHIVAAKAATQGVPPTPAGLYCASARGLTVALGIRGASEHSSRQACENVRRLVIDTASRAANSEGRRG